jgi:hypothetical protein
MKPLTLIEIIDAAHLTAFVDSPFQQRGGLMLIGPPETLRTTCIEIALSQHPSALIMADTNMKTLTSIKDEFCNGRYSSIGFLDYQKIYERGQQTAANVEGTIRMMIEEGYTRTSHDDPSSPSTKARAFVVAAVVESMFREKAGRWRDTGFMRRWLCCLLHMPAMSRNKLIGAIHDWKKLDFDAIYRISPTTPIPYNISIKESEWLFNMVQHQPSQATPFVLLKKIFSVLKWKYKKEPKKAITLLENFAPSLSKNGAPIEL